MKFGISPPNYAPSNPRNDIQRPRVTIEQAADVIGAMADLGLSEMIIDVPPGRNVYLEQLQTVAGDGYLAPCPTSSLPEVSKRKRPELVHEP